MYDYFHVRRAIFGMGRILNRGKNKDCYGKETMSHGREKNYYT